MAIQRWDPLRDLLDLQGRMKQLFEEALSRSAGAGPETGWRPPMDLFEEARRYVLLADIPGVAAGDVEIHVEDGTLHVRGERKPTNGVSGDAFLRVERPRGKFAAQISLPPSVDAQAIQATHRNGVVEIVLPKRQKRAANRIRVSTRSASD